MEIHRFWMVLLPSHTHTHTHTRTHTHTHTLTHTHTQIHTCTHTLCIFYPCRVLGVYTDEVDMCVPRDPKAPVEIRERQESLVRGDRRDTEDSPVCRVCPDLR